jgi:hypothetical protein
MAALGRFKEAHKHIDQAREIVVRFKHRTLTAQFDSTRAELLITEGKIQKPGLIMSANPLINRTTERE